LYVSLPNGFVDAVAFLNPGVSFLRDVILQDDGEGPYVKAWNLPGSPPTDQEVADALLLIPASQIAANKVLAKAILDDSIPIGRDLRAIILLMVDELNLIRAWITSLKAANATATSYGTLKTGIAALNNMPARTNSQVKTAVKDAVDAE
jgi:hypothetical protein